MRFSVIFAKIFKNNFLTDHLCVTDIRMQVVVIYNSNLFLQFVTICIFLFCEFPHRDMFQSRLNFCIDFFLDKVVFRHALQDCLYRKIITKHNINKIIFTLFTIDYHVKHCNSRVVFEL